MYINIFSIRHVFMKIQFFFKCHVRDNPRFIYLFFFLTAFFDRMEGRSIAKSNSENQDSINKCQ